MSLHSHIYTVSIHIMGIVREPYYGALSLHPTFLHGFLRVAVGGRHSVP